MAMAAKPEDENQGASTVGACPFCGSRTPIEREPEPALVSVSLLEFETLVMNEWRRRLGPAAYGREQPMSLVRALAAYALDPEEPPLSDTVDAEFRQQVKRMSEWTTDRREMWWQLIRLSQAMWDVISWTDLEFDRSRELMERIDAKILQALELL